MKAFTVSTFVIVSVICQNVVADSSAKWRHPSLTKTPSKSLSSSEMISYQSVSDVVDIRAGAKVVAPKQSEFMKDLIHRLKIGFYFALWYALNIVYNILNKRLLNILPAPMIVGSLQLGVGAFYVLILWATNLRPMPVLTDQGRKATRQVGFWHATGQLFSMISLGAGPVSFTHIVKALEPFFSAIVSALCFGTWMPASVYATLLPVVGGVGYACLKERSFSWLAFTMAMASNLSFALRAVLSKVAMSSSGIGTNLTPPNVFGLVTLSAFLLSIPMALLGEGRQFLKLWRGALEQQPSTLLLVRSILVSGFFHYINNEVMFFALGQVHPITLAVGNTMKRVFIMVASVIAFGNHISLQAGIGSAVGLSGVLLYSIATQSYEKSLATTKADKKR